MANSNYVTGDELVRLKPDVMNQFRQLSEEPVTRPAAFGICCCRLMRELGCDLRVAAMLLDCWVTEDCVKH